MSEITSMINMQCIVKRNALLCLQHKQKNSMGTAGAAFMLDYTFGRRIIYRGAKGNSYFAQPVW